MSLVDVQALQALAGEAGRGDLSASGGGVSQHC